MKEVLNMILNIVFVENPACLKMILMSPAKMQAFCYCAVNKKMTPPSFVVYYFAAGYENVF